MGAVAAVFSKLQVDAPRLVAKMLCAMRHRAQDAAGVAWDERLESEPSPGLLSVSSSTQHTAVGYGFTRILPDDDPQPVRLGDGWLCLDGRIVADRMMVGGAEAARYLQDRLAPVEFTSIHFDIDGAYSICYCKNHELLVTRDSLGLKPLFIASREDLVAVASDRKALYSIGMSDIAGFPPGASLTANQEGSILKRPAKPQARPQAGGVSTNDLLQLLVESVSIHTTGLSSVAVGFSGGLDSAIIAKMAKDAGVDVLLTTIGVGRTLEMIQAESAAREIGLPIVVRELSRDDVEQSVDRVLWLIEDPSLMKVSIAVAIYWTTRVAAENGRSVILLGQGSDELFGGYKRFATILGEHGAKSCEEAISQSISQAHEVNYQRDEQAVSSLRVELRLPFATRRMTELALRVPLKMKVRSPSDGLRKWVLRDAAIKLGMSSKIALRPKRAIQHASGIEKVIRDAAKRHRLPPSEYLVERLQAIKKESGVD